MSPASPERSNLVEILQQRIAEQPNKTAYIFLKDGEQPDGQLTYQELDREARKIALYCRSLVSPGERALLLYPPGLEFITAFFGCLYAGIVAIPVYPPTRNQKLSRLRSIVKDARSLLVLTTASVKEDWQSEPMLARSHWIATDRIDLDPQDWQVKYPVPEQLAMLQYTSGSIGEPKGVMVSHGNLTHNLQMIRACFGHDRDTLGINWLPHYHDMGSIGGILQSVYGGFPVTIMPPVAFIRKPIRWLQAISRYKITASGAPNFAYDLCVAKIKPEQLAELDLSSWQLAFTGAEPIRAETLNRFADTFASCGFRREALHACYGLAESTLFVSGSLPRSTLMVKWVEAKALAENQIIDSSPEVRGSRALVSCGRSWSEQKILIVDPQSRQVLAERQVGEIWVTGGSVALGYWDRVRETKEQFQACLADGSGSFLRTGDLGFFLDGELYVTGRLKDVIVIRGRNYYPQDIELIVQKSNPGLISDCGAAFLVEIEDRERLIVVQEVERSQIGNLNVPEIARQIAQAVSIEHGLSVYAIALIKTGSIPKTSSGKIQRRACRESYLKGELKIVGEWRLLLGSNAVSKLETVSPAEDVINNWLKKWLAKRSAIAVESIDSNATFADYGLDSIIAMELTQDLEDWLNYPLDPATIWNFSHLHALGQYLATQIAIAPKEVDLVAEAILDPAIYSTSEARSQIEPTTILLTGATGFLGAFLLAELLRQTQAQIYCLVRATDVHAGKVRIQKNLANYQLWQQHFSERIVPIIGDLSQPQLGLTEKQWNILAERVDIIYHNGALLNYVYPYNRLKPTNVLGTESILKLASFYKTKPIHYISSTAVFDCHSSDFNRSIVTELDFIDRPQGMHLGYSQSKWVADKMMQTARERGIPVCIYRPSFIGGHSQTGIANTEDIIWRIIQGSLQMGYLPEIDLDLDLTPVDYVSQNIVILSKQNCFNETTFHLNHPHPLPWNRLVSFIRDTGDRIRSIPLEQWLEKLEPLVNSTNPLYPLIPFFLNRLTDDLTILELMQLRKSPQVSCQGTVNRLAQIDRAFACPALDQKLWGIYFNKNSNEK